MDSTFWAFIGLVLFIAVLFYFKVPQSIRNQLDGRSNKIRSEIEEARRLREEAQAVLAEYKRKRQEALKEAEEIVTEAKVEAERLAEETNIALEQLIIRKTKAAEAKIAHAESSAITEVRTRVVDLAVLAAEKVIKEKVTGDIAEDLMKNTIGEVESKLS